MSVHVDVEKNKIVMTRGDTLRVRVGVTVDDEEYTPKPGEEVRFALKHPDLNAAQTEYKDPEPLIYKVIPIETLILELEPADTKSLGFGKYDYDVQITFDDGAVDTFISSTLKLTKEVD